MNMSSPYRRTRQRLLAGVPLLLCALSAPVDAQTSAVSDGQTTIVTDQRVDGAVVQSTTASPAAAISVEGLVEAQILVAGGSTSSTAQINDSVHALSTRAGADMVSPVRVVIQDNDLHAEGAAISASRQELRGSSAFAHTSGPAVSLSIGRASGSAVRLEADLQGASARGNVHIAELDDATGSGVGIVATQRADAASALRSTVAGLTVLGFGEAEHSLVRLDRNTQQVIGTGNSAGLTLDVDAPTQKAGENAGATLFTSDRDVEIYAGSATLAHQNWAGSILARIGATDATAGYLTSGGALSASTVTTDENRLEASAIANSSAIEHGSNASRVEGLGSIAANLIVQDVAGPVAAHLTGDTLSQFTGPVAHSTISVSGNEAAARAAGNVSDTALFASLGASGSIENGSMPIAAVRIGDDSTTRTEGGHSVHTEQTASGGSIFALARSASGIGFDDMVLASRAITTGNRQTADAVANEAQSMLSLAATDRASAASSLVQSNDADVGTVVGSETEYAGATLAPQEVVQDSQLEIRDNRIDARSIGNRGTNAMTISATELAGTPSSSRAGSIDGGFGAVAGAALATIQRTGQPGAATAIVSQITGRFSVTGDGPTRGSTIDINGNHQQASSTANSVENSLSLTAARIDGAGAALAVSQYGDASVQALSTMRIVSRGALEQSSSRIDDNRNVATAAMNIANNTLDIEALGPLSDDSARLSANPLGSAAAEGGNILVNTQFATGIVLANATTLIAGSPGSAEMAVVGPIASSFKTSGNLTVAQASGNEALNQARLRTSASGGIASSQVNAASVTATASATAFLDIPQPDRSVHDSALSFSGNSTSALARGNVAENHLSFVDWPGTGTGAQGRADRSSATADAPVGLVTSQSNHGVITASVEGPNSALPLNGNGVPLDGSNLVVADNALAATAYGNGVANSVTPVFGGGGIALVTSQTNSGPVTARATAASTNVHSGDVRGSTLDITGNSLTASATGNFATNIVGVPR